MAEIIEWPEEIDLDRAEHARERAEERLRSKTPETDVLRAETALQRSLARIHVLKSLGLIHQRGEKSIPLTGIDF